MNIITHNILIDLDCILDTRLAIYHLIDTNLPARLLDNGYYTRYTDEMPGVITKEERKEYLYRYKNRGNDSLILNYAIPTNINKYLVDFYHGYTADQIVATTGKRSTCYINIHPYIVPDIQRQMIRNLLVKDLFPYCNIEVVNIDTSKINIETMVHSYSEYITYESNQFISHWLVDYEGFVSPAFKLIIPKIAIGDKALIDVQDDVELSREKLYDGMEAIRTSCSGIFYLGFLPPQFYSPRKPPQRSSVDI